MQPGWYPTPQGPRYFDGRQWTLPAPAIVDRVAPPVLGWLITAAGGLITIGSFMAWATALGGVLSVSGTAGHDGWISVVLGLLIAAAGIVIGLKQGFVGFSITSVVLNLLALVLAIYEIHHVSRTGIDVGPGLWTILLAALAGIGLSIGAALARVER